MITAKEAREKLQENREKRYDEAFKLLTSVTIPNAVDNLGTYVSVFSDTIRAFDKLKLTEAGYELKWKDYNGLEILYISW